MRHISKKILQHKNLISVAFLFLFPMILGIYLIGAYQWDLTVPFVYLMHDDIWQLVLTKALIDNGWVLQNEFLGAPDISNWHYHAAAQSSSLHSILMLFISLFIEDAVKVQQVYYFLNFSLISLTTFWASRLLKISTLFSVAIAIIFAFTTFRINSISYAFLNNFFMIPLAITVVVWCSTSEFSPKNQSTIKEFGKHLLRSSKFYFAVLVIALTTLSDGYFAFFTLLLLGLAIFLSFINSSNNRVLNTAIPAFLCVTIISISLVMLIPLQMYKNANLEEFYPNGQTKSVFAKHPFEAEVYSTSLKMIVAPLTNHRSQKLSEIGHKIVKTSDDSRKFASRAPQVPLGFIVSICLAISLLFLGVNKIAVSNDAFIDPNSALKKIRTYAVLSVFVLLSSVYGGIGTLVALIYPTIRAYDRFPLFLIVLVLLLVSYFATVSLSKRKRQNFFTVLIVIGITSFAVWDQSTVNAFRSKNEPHMVRYLAEREFIGKIESELDENSMIYQFPFSQFLNNNRYYGHGAHGHVRAYLHSKNIRWSNGASKNSPIDLWHSAYASLPLENILLDMQAYGFAGVLVDKRVLDDKEFLEASATIKRLYGDVLEVNERAEMAFFKFPDLGFKLINDKKYKEIKSIEVYDASILDKDRLLEYVDADVLSGFLNSEEFQNSTKAQDTIKPMIDVNFTRVHAYNKKLDDSILMGDVTCKQPAIKLSQSNTHVELEVKNRSSGFWQFNSGNYRLAMGYHIYDEDNNLIEWDNAYRVPNLGTLASGEEKTISVEISDLRLNEVASDKFYLVFELLQEANKWFGFNNTNNSCRISVSR